MFPAQLIDGAPNCVLTPHLVSTRRPLGIAAGFDHDRAFGQKLKRGSRALARTMFRELGPDQVAKALSIAHARLERLLTDLRLRGFRGRDQLILVESAGGSEGVVCAASAFD